jgi:hypothetical protein
LEAASNTHYKAFVLIGEAFENGGDPWSKPLWVNSEFEWIEERAGDLEVPESHRSDFYRGIFEALLDQWLEVKDEVVG